MNMENKNENLGMYIAMDGTMHEIPSLSLYIFSYVKEDMQTHERLRENMRRMVDTVAGIPEYPKYDTMQLLMTTRSFIRGKIKMERVPKNSYRKSTPEITNRERAVKALEALKNMFNKRINKIKRQQKKEKEATL